MFAASQAGGEWKSVLPYLKQCSCGTICPGFSYRSLHTPNSQPLKDAHLSSWLGRHMLWPPTYHTPGRINNKCNTSIPHSSRIAKGLLGVLA